MSRLATIITYSDYTTSIQKLTIENITQAINALSQGLGVSTGEGKAILSVEVFCPVNAKNKRFMCSDSGESQVRMIMDRR